MPKGNGDANALRIHQLARVVVDAVNAERQWRQENGSAWVIRFFAAWWTR